MYSPGAKGGNLRITPPFIERMQFAPDDYIRGIRTAAQWFEAHIAVADTLNSPWEAPHESYWTNLDRKEVVANKEKKRKSQIKNLQIK